MNKTNKIKQTVSVIVSIFLINWQTLAAGAIKLDPKNNNKAGHTTLDTAANGVDVVNIARPNSNGVSHNQYIEFNVPTQGVILNNAKTDTKTKLSGYIYGNENVKKHQANLILNEVTSTNRSHLNGYLEVAGKSADVIVANPNGITVNGGGFINIPKATLTTGKVSFDGKNHIYSVNSGDILIDGAGLDASSTNSLNIYTKALKLNAAIWANKLNVVTGKNRIKNGVATKIGDSDDEFSIDSTALGGIYAGAIKLIGTSKGVGVNLPPEVLAQDSLEISSDGKIVINSAKVKNGATITSKSGSITVAKGIYANSANFNAKGAISLSGNSGVATTFNLKGGSLVNSGYLAAGVDSDFNTLNGGKLNLDFKDSIKNSGTMFASSALNLNALSFINSSNAAVIGGDFNATTDSFRNSGDISTSLVTIKSGTAINSGLIQSSSNFSLNSNSLDNSNGSIESLGNLNIDIDNNFTNTNGSIYANDNLNIKASNLDSKDSIIIAKANNTLDIANNLNLDNSYIEGINLDINAKGATLNGANVLSYGLLNITANSLSANSATIQAADNLDIEVANTFNNSNNALIYSDKDISINSKDFNHDNNSTLQALGNISINSSNLNNQDSTISANKINIDAQDINNANGAIEALKEIVLKFKNLYTQGGSIVTNTTASLDGDDINATDAAIYAGSNLDIKANDIDNSNSLIRSDANLTLNANSITGKNSEIVANSLNIKANDFNQEQSTIKSSTKAIVNITNTLTLNKTQLLANALIKLSAKDANINSSTLYSANDHIELKSQNANIEDSTLLAKKRIDLDIQNTLNSKDSSYVANSVTVKTDNLANSGTNQLSAKNSEINTTTLNNQNATLVLDSNKTVINSTNLNTINGLISSTQDLTINSQYTDVTNANIEVANILKLNSANLTLKDSTLFAGSLLSLTTNIDTIDSGSKIVSLGDMNLNFNNNLTNNGTLGANNDFKLSAKDVTNNSSIVSIGSFNLKADSLKNNTNNTNASIKVGGNSKITLKNSLENSGFLLSSNNLEINASNITNKAVIASGNNLILNSTNLNNYNTIYSGNNMNLYIADTLTNNKDANIFSVGNMLIAKDANGNKSSKIENIAANIESVGDMNLSAKTIENKSLQEPKKGLKESSNTTLHLIHNGLFGPYKYHPNQKILKKYQKEIVQKYIDNGDVTVLDHPKVDYGIHSNQENVKVGNEYYPVSSPLIVKISNSRYIFFGKIEYVKNISKKVIENKSLAIKFRKEVADALIKNIYSKYGIWVKDNEIKDLHTRVYSLEGLENLNKTELERKYQVKTEQEYFISMPKNQANIKAGKFITFNSDTLHNQFSTISAGKDIKFNTNKVKNDELVLNKITTTNVKAYVKVGKTGGLFGTGFFSDDKYGWVTIKNESKTEKTGAIGSAIIAGGTISGNINKALNGVKENQNIGGVDDNIKISTSNESLDDKPTSIDKKSVDKNNLNNKLNQKGQTQTVEVEELAKTPTVYDVSQEVKLPTNQYGLYVKNKDPKGPLIISNPEYVNYDNFVSSAYMLKHLNYDATKEVRVLGDAMYETKLISDAIVKLTGQRFIGNAKSDSEQFVNLMDNALSVANKLGLKVGKPLSQAQLKKLKKDIVWMVKKKVNGVEVLVPTLYLAKKYKKASGALISANSIDLTIDGNLANSGDIRALTDLKLKTGTLNNYKGNIEAKGAVDIKSVGDIKNLSGSIKGGAVSLTSKKGNIENRTLTHKLSTKDKKAHFTQIDKKALIKSTKGAVVINAHKTFTNAGANVASASSISIKAKDVDIKTIKDKSSYNYKYKNAQFKGESVKHIQSSIKAKGNLVLDATNNINLEAAKLKGQGVKLTAGNKINSKAVVDSKYNYSHTKSSGFLSSSSTTDAKLSQSVKGTTIKGTNVIVNAKNDVNLEATDINAKETLDITSKKGNVNLSTKAYTNASFHEKKSSALFGLFKSKSVDSKTILKQKGTNTEANSQITLNGKNVNITGSSVKVGNGNVFITAQDKVNIKNATESTTEQHIREKSGLFQGGHLYQKRKDESITYDERAKGSVISAGGKDVTKEIKDIYAKKESVRKSKDIAYKITNNNKKELAAFKNNTNKEADKQSSKGNVVIKAGSVDVTGSDIVAANNIIAKTDIGSITIKDAKEKHSTYKKHEELNIDLTLGAKVKGDEVGVTFAKATYDKEKTTSKGTTSRASNLQAGNTVDLDSIEDIKIKGSNVAAGGDVNLKAKEDIVITSSQNREESKTDKTHAEAELSIGVKSDIVTAALAAKNLKDSTKRFNEAKRALNKQKEKIKEYEKQYKEGKISKADLDEAKDNLKYYQANVALAAKDVATSAKAAAQAGTKAAASGITGGFSGGLTLDVSGSKTNSQSQSTTNQASNISAGNSVNISTKNGDTTIKGSNIIANEAINVDTNNLNIIASKDTNKNSSNTKSFSASATIGTSGISSASIGGGYSKSNGSSTNYNNSQLNANNINLHSKKDTNIAGANIQSQKSTTLNVDGNLNVSSLQDEEKNKELSINAGVGFNKDGKNANASFNKTKGNYKAVTNQTTIGSKGTLTINTKNNTNLKGALLKGEKGSSLNTGTLTYQNIKNQATYNSTGAGVSYNTKDKTSFNSSLPQNIKKSQSTKATIDNNIKVTINNKTKQTQDITKINHNTKDASYTLTKIDTKALQIREDLANKTAKEGFKAVGDYAMEQAAKGDKAWEDGGVKKSLAHAIVGATVAAIGNGDAVGGALGAGARELASKATKDKDKTTQQVVSTLIGGAVSGGTGASVALKGEKFNRQLHQKEIELIKKNAEAFAAYYKAKTGKDITKEEALEKLSMTALAGVDSKHASRLDVDDNARVFLENLAKENGGVAFIDSKGRTQHMFSESDKSLYNNYAVNANDMFIDGAKNVYDAGYKGKHPKTRQSYYVNTVANLAQGSKDLANEGSDEYKKFIINSAELSNDKTLSEHDRVKLRDNSKLGLVYGMNSGAINRDEVSITGENKLSRIYQGSLIDGSQTFSMAIGGVGVVKGVKNLNNKQVELTLENGERVVVPKEAVVKGSDGKVRIDTRYLEEKVKNMKNKEEWTEEQIKLAERKKAKLVKEIRNGNAKPNSKHGITSQERASLTRKYRRDLKKRINSIYKNNPTARQNALDRLERSHIDHQLDLQLNGKNVRANLKALDSSVNSSYGKQLDIIIKNLEKQKK